jgi:hypothetical protein
MRELGFASSFLNADFVRAPKASECALLGAGVQCIWMMWDFVSWSGCSPPPGLRRAGDGFGDGGAHSMSEWLLGFFARTLLGRVPGGWRVPTRETGHAGFVTRYLSPGLAQMSACFDLYLLEQTVTQCGRTFEPYRPQRYRPFNLSIYVNKQKF